MYEGNIDIDKPRKKWYPIDIERLFIFCMLDRAMPYEKVCEVYWHLNVGTLTMFKKIKQQTTKFIAVVLKRFGHRFPNQTAEFIKYNTDKYTYVDLWNMSRDELAKNIKGFSYKLASMFHNRLHNTQYAIIDVHVDRFLERLGLQCKSYLEKEEKLKVIAETLGMTMEELDWKIWNTNRIGNR